MQLHYIKEDMFKYHGISPCKILDHHHHFHLQKIFIKGSKKLSVLSGRELS